jgi:hypothetical protein
MTSQQEISGWKHKRLQDISKTVVPDNLSKSKKISKIWLSETPTTIKRTNFVPTCHQISFSVKYKTEACPFY